MPTCRHASGPSHVVSYSFVIKERREQEFLDLSAEERLVKFWEGSIPP